ncbi:MAG: hypothetical protein RLY86_2926 [Pseudomonadota bacterium]|jgi:hypothetical protein
MVPPVSGLGPAAGPVPYLVPHPVPRIVILGTGVAGLEAARAPGGAPVRVTAWPAWILWAIRHVYLLVGFEKRLLETVQWLWRYLTYQRGARLITETDERPDAPPDFGSGRGWECPIGMAAWHGGHLRGSSPPCR